MGRTKPAPEQILRRRDHLRLFLRTLAYRTRLSHEKSGTRQMVISRTAVYRTRLPTPARPVVAAPFAFAGSSGWVWAGKLFGSG